jgi:hypothetical protein
MDQTPMFNSSFLEGELIPVFNGIFRESLPVDAS